MLSRDMRAAPDATRRCGDIPFKPAAHTHQLHAYPSGAVKAVPCRPRDKQPGGRQRPPTRPAACRPVSGSCARAPAAAPHGTASNG